MPDFGTLRNAPAGVSIAIPNWNHEQLLARSVGSALRAVRDLRTHGADAEVLVVDDASRDGSLTLLRQFEALYFDDGLRVLALGKNGGLPALTRNIALGAARFRHIFMLDADNELSPENLWHFYRASLQTGAAVVCGNLLGFDAGTAARMISGESYQQRILKANYIDTMMLADQLQLTDAGGVLDDPLMIAREDWELYLHLAATGRRVIFVPLVMGYYHDMPGSLTRHTDRESIHNKQRAWIDRVYDQLAMRGDQPLNTHNLRYHPDVGYL